MSRETDIAWAAGLFEGEGTCFGYAPKKGNPTIRLRVAMADEESVQRFARVVGRGRVHGPYRHGKPHWAPLYSWQVEGWSTAESIMGLLMPYLSTRRREQYEAVLKTRVQLQAA